MDKKEVGVFLVFIFVIVLLFLGVTYFSKNIFITGNAIYKENSLIERFNFERTLVGDKGGYSGFGAGHPYTKYNPSYAEGKIGDYSVYYNENELDWGNLTNSEKYNPGEDSFTYALWFKTTDVNGTILQKSSSNTYYLLRMEEGKIRTMLKVGGKQYSFYSTDSRNYNDGEWHHVMVSFWSQSNGEKSHRLYLDGEGRGLVDTTGIDSIENNGDFRIAGTGGYEDLYWKWDGYLDDLRFYRVAMNNQDAKKIMNESESVESPDEPDIIGEDPLEPAPVPPPDTFDPVDPILTPIEGIFKFRVPGGIVYKKASESEYILKTESLDYVYVDASQNVYFYDTSGTYDCVFMEDIDSGSVTFFTSEANLIDINENEINEINELFEEMELKCV